MRIFRLPPRSKYLQSESPKERLLRLLVIVVLFGVVAAGVWMKDKQYKDIARKKKDGADTVVDRTFAAQTFVDATGNLTKTQEAQLQVYIKRFSAVYGIALVLRIVDAPLPQFDPSTGRPTGDPSLAGKVVLLISPAQKDVFFYAPPLVQSALGGDFSTLLSRERLLPRFQDGTWPEGLAEILSEMSRRLDAAAGRTR